MKIGDRVLLKKSYAKWHLDNPEIYFCGSHVDLDYEDDTLIHLMCCFDVPVIGTVKSYGVECWGVEFKVAGLKTFYYVDKKHITKENNNEKT